MEKTKNQTMGTAAELAVARDLQNRGLILLAHQFSVPRLGELDLVLCRDNRLYVVEVKARSNRTSFGGALAAITPAKIRRIRKTALYFMQAKELMNNEIRLLAAEVLLIDGLPSLPIRYEPIE
ncbi:MAG: YraN family protein [Eubacteriales bacterium]|nr:YraN family protein [Eubacteriales bacterium]